MVRLAKLTEFRAKILFAFVGAYLASWALILVAIYVALDDQYLKEIFRGDFEKLQQKLNVAHFYIGDAQGRQIVRLHAPGKYGDTALRYQKIAKNNGLETTRRGNRAGPDTRTRPH